MKFQAGGPFYPLQTGRRDSTLSFGETAALELPSPQDDLPKTIASFGSRGFDERETVSLLGIKILPCLLLKGKKGLVFALSGFQHILSCHFHIIVVVCQLV